MNHEITIRPATVSDAQEILNIYAPYIKETAITYEYDVPSLEEFIYGKKLNLWELLIR